MTFSLKRSLYAIMVFGIICTILSAKKKDDALYIHTSTQVIREGESGRDVLLRCIILPEIAKKMSERDLEFHFYARNNIRKIDFELTDENYLPFRAGLTPIPGRRFMVFETSWDKLFFLTPDRSPYHWQWEGKAEPPLSPLSDIGGEKVKEIQCWFTVKVNGKTYKSEKISYEVNSVKVIEQD
jgi:hypothetical protein